MIRLRSSTLLGLLLLGTVASTAQESLQSMPRYERYSRLRTQIAGSIKSGAVTVNWTDDSKSFTYVHNDKLVKFDVATLNETATDTAATNPGRQNGRRRRGAPERGRQFDTAASPDGKYTAIHRDRNLYMKVGTAKEVPITTDGNAAKRIKYGTASWVYGEELGVSEAMWWSPDSAKLAYYRFDESEVLDYYLGMDQTKIQAKLDAEPYPKAGAPNPKVGLLVYDVASAKSLPIDASFGAPELGHYVYDVRWSPKGDELLFNRTNRKQNIMEICAANPSTGKCRVIVREEWKSSWVENHPAMTYLEDKNRFILHSERNGFGNYYLYDLSGKLLNPITQNKFDADTIVSVDEKASVVYYMARSAENPYLSQLHRVGLDGHGDVRMTDPGLSHSVNLAPDAQHFIDVAVSATEPASTRLVDANGKVLKTLTTSDLTEFDKLGLRRVERFTFLAADGKTTCYGRIAFPSDFDSTKKYPVVVSVYAGPESSGGAETFSPPNPITELGFLAVTIDGRGTKGRGKAFRDAVYRNLGIAEIDDQAAGVLELAKRPYVDAKRVGIYGTSYGGYASAMAILRHPEVFSVAVASSSVTQWRNYDSIYTERYMDVPQDNAAGYENGSAMKYASNLKGHLMLYFGTADNNVHPSNTIQLVQALNAAGKRYDMQVGPDLGHTGVNANRMWEYFVTHLILRPAMDPIKAAGLRVRR